MLLYLIQHGKAEPKEINPDRPLSEEGRRETDALARRFAGLSPDIHVIWHSRKTRARETAKIIASALKIPNRTLEHSSLAPADPVEPVMSELSSASRNKAIVGHLPFLEKLLLGLLDLPADASPLEFRNSAVICLIKHGNIWKLRWILHPDMAEMHIL